MKTLLLEKLPESCGALPAAEFPASVCLPDSAIVAQGKPIFIPHCAEGFSLFFCPVLRITRLGKTIAERFAPRYYSEIAPMVRLAPAADPFGVTAAVAAGDFMASLGNFTPLPAGGSAVFTFEGSLMESSLTIPFPDLRRDMDRAVSLLSRIMTLRNGDLISPSTHILPSARIPVPGLTLEVRSGDGILSRFRFK